MRGREDWGILGESAAQCLDPGAGYQALFTFPTVSKPLAYLLFMPIVSIQGKKNQHAHFLLSALIYASGA